MQLAKARNLLIFADPALLKFNPRMRHFGNNILKEHNTLFNNILYCSAGKIQSQKTARLHVLYIWSHIKMVHLSN